MRSTVDRSGLHQEDARHSGVEIRVPDDVEACSERGAREVLLALLEEYRAGSVEELPNAQVLRLPPLDAMGQVVRVTRTFGGIRELQQAQSVV